MKTAWLGDLPSGWQEIALRYLAVVETGSRDTVDATPDGDYPFIIRSQKPLRIGSYSYDTEAVLTAGDGAVGEIFHHVKGKFEVHQRVYVIHNFRGLLGRYFYYYFSSQFGQTVAYGGAQSTVASLRRPMLTNFPVAVPPLERQRAIADYLDGETAQIDAFISKNEELIALLTERRTAAITRTVTGSQSGEADGQGATWTEGLPSEWRLLPLKSLAKRVTDGAHISPETDDGEYDFVSTRDISAGLIDYEGSLKTSSRTYSYMVRTGCQPKVGDVLYSKDGTIGETAVVKEPREFVVASSLVIITPDPSMAVSDYLRYALRSVPLLEQAKTLVRGAGLPRLSIANLATVRVPLPPLSVQQELVSWLDQVTGSIDSAIEIARRSVKLARERRAALISAAVTGKIDVGVVT